MTADRYRQTRMRSWLFLWIIALIWLLSIFGIPSGIVPLWLFGVITAVGFISAWWLNLRMVTMHRRIADGKCWKCGYALEGIDAKRCPECGMDV